MKKVCPNDEKKKAESRHPASGRCRAEKQETALAAWLAVAYGVTGSSGSDGRGVRGLSGRGIFLNLMSRLVSILSF
ncbi:hypothetical protein LP417_02450 [Polaromonas sp. P1-6]|nr:hypothetical protein LP417_02450 [Polaromonas sp. P1-6]